MNDTEKINNILPSAVVDSSLNNVKNAYLNSSGHRSNYIWHTYLFHRHVIMNSLEIIIIYIYRCILSFSCVTNTNHTEVIGSHSCVIHACPSVFSIAKGLTIRAVLLGCLCTTAQHGLFTGHAPIFGMHFHCRLV